MKTKFIGLFLITIFASCVQNDKELLNKTITKLNSLDKLEYKVNWSLRDNNFAISDTVKCFFDFLNPDINLGPKYHFENNRYEEVFNNKTAYSVFKDRGQIIYSEQPTENVLNRSISRITSFYYIKKLLPTFLKDSSNCIIRQNDTLINNERNYNFKITLKNPVKLSDILNSTRFLTDSNLIISSKDYIPIQVNYILADGTLNAKFSEINLIASRPDSTWNIERFTKEYMLRADEDLNKNDKAKISGKIGENAPDWRLPLISGDTVQLSNLYGNLILLEFWFPGCKPCLELISDLNDLQFRYSNKGLKIYGIEFTKYGKEIIKEYVSKHGIKYPILYNGNQVADWYGIYMAPSIYLINKKGLIIYSSQGFNKNELLKAIDLNMQQNDKSLN